MTAPLPRIDAAELKSLLDSEAGVAVLDVRTPAEFEAAHIPGSYNVPLELLPEHAHDVTRQLAKSIVLVCQSGSRATEAQRCLVDVQLDAGSVLEGGISAYQRAGGHVVRGARRWAMDRQVRMAAGTLVLLGFLGGKLLHPKLGYLPAAIGAGLAYSAASDSCAMAAALSKMPWNTARSKTGSNPLDGIQDAGQRLAPGK